MPCNSFRSSLLQLLGLQNPNSADLLGLDKQVRPCSTSAGNSENWKLNFYRPDKKQGGGSFQHCFFLWDSENNLCRCVKFWWWVRLVPSGRRRMLSWTAGPQQVWGDGDGDLHLLNITPSYLI